MMKSSVPRSLVPILAAIWSMMDDIVAEGVELPVLRDPLVVEIVTPCWSKYKMGGTRRANMETNQGRKGVANLEQEGW